MTAMPTTTTYPIGPGSPDEATWSFLTASTRTTAACSAVVISMTDMYLPIADARYEARFIAHCTLAAIPSLWGHPAGAAVTAADGKFLNDHIAAFLAGAGVE
jgi:hypothetical protein